MTRHFQISSDTSLLNRPVWGALTTRLESLSNSFGTARMMAPDVSPMAAPAGFRTDQLQDFASLILQRPTPLITLERETPVPDAPHLLKGSATCVQMIAQRPMRPNGKHKIEKLTKADADDMYRLATTTKPGPFERNTHTLGEFIGIKRDGHLVAMAGERLKISGYVEISAVCVAPDHRSHGMGAELVRQMCDRILSQGDIPILHAYQSNRDAIALYESLGFQTRATMQASRWARADIVQNG